MGGPGDNGRVCSFVLGRHATAVARVSMRAVVRAMLKAIGGLTDIVESGVDVIVRHVPAFSHVAGRPPVAPIFGVKVVVVLHDVARVEGLAPRETSGSPVGSLAPR